MQIRPLPPQDRLNGLATHKVIITSDDLAAGAAAATQTLQIFPSGTGTVPAGTIVRFAAMRLVTPFDFSDAGLISCAIEVGDGSDVDRFLTSTELANDGTYVSNKASAASSQPYAYDAADGIDAKFTGTATKSLATANAGEVEIYLHISQVASHA